MEKEKKVKNVPTLSSVDSSLMYLMLLLILKSTYMKLKGDQRDIEKYVNTGKFKR